MDEDGFQLVSNRKTYKARCARNNKIDTINKHSHVDRISSKKVTDIFSMLQEHQKEITESSFWKQFLDVLKGDMTFFCPSNEESMSDVRIVCYGIGEFADQLISSYQMALLMALRGSVKQSDVYDPDVQCSVYDPVLLESEKQVLKELNMDVIGHNEEGKRRIDSLTLFYMPHCGKPLYNNLLWANWSVESLSQLCIIGNSFSNIVERTPKRILEKEAYYITKIEPYMKEENIANTFHHKDVFNDLAVITFPHDRLLTAPVDLWTDNIEPVYNEQDLEIIVNKR